METKQQVKRSNFYRRVPDNVPFLYRGDTRSPQEIQAKRGFLPPSPPQSYKAYSIREHALATADTVYVSATYKFAVAAADARRLHQITGDSKDLGWVYRIRATPNMINIEGTLLQYYHEPGEAEFAALGGIRWDQVEAYWRVTEEYARKHPLLTEDDVLGSWDNVELDEVAALFTRNPNYSNQTYSLSTSGSGKPELAGFPRHHRARQEEPWRRFGMSAREHAIEYMASIGFLGGWVRQYPLFPTLAVPDEPGTTPDMPPPFLWTWRGRNQMNRIWKGLFS
ncbi:hypothetical protein CP533_1238 [Ophiocordyceps camponoti-saundersi (nom. inval.)]|nr:hypothetical protein CP533_1238 [Ophiocordyceps camponoti-saundersi (nom. inval.)]